LRYTLDMRENGFWRRGMDGLYTGLDNTLTSYRPDCFGSLRANEKETRDRARCTKTWATWRCGGRDRRQGRRVPADALLHGDEPHRVRGCRIALYVLQRMEGTFFEQVQREQSAFFARAQMEFMRHQEATARDDMLMLHEASHVNLTHVFSNVLWDADFSPSSSRCSRFRSTTAAPLLRAREWAMLPSHRMRGKHALRGGP